MFSGSEMKYFVKYFSFIIGDLVPTDNPVWELYLSLQQILNILEENDIVPVDSVLLATSIDEHHSIYIKYFGNLKLDC